MNRHKKDIEFSEFVKASKRIYKIWDILRDLPKKPLDKKLFAGHWRFFVVRKDVLRSSIGGQIQKVIDATNTWVLGNKKVPSSYRCSKEVFEGHWCDPAWLDGQGLRSLSQADYDAANFPDFFEKKWFSVHTKTKSLGTKNIEIKRYYPKVPKHMIEYGYKRGYITETPIKDGDLESELSRLYRFMEDHNGWVKLSGNRRDEWDMSLDKKKKLKRIAEKETVKELCDY